MKILTSITCLILLVFNLNAQENIDSIETNLEDRDLDTNLINDYLILGNFYRKTDSLKAITYIEKAFQLASDLKNRTKKGEALLLKGNFHVLWGYDLEKALSAYETAAALFRAEKNNLLELDAITRMGFYYGILGDDSKSFAIYEDALKRHHIH